MSERSGAGKHESPSRLIRVTDARGLNGLADLLASQSASEGLPPVHLWEPDYCGEIGLKITRSGQWTYQGSPIGRKELVRIFSRVLRHDDDGYFLVTPVEKIAIEVEDAPFVAVEMDIEGEGSAQQILFRSNVGDVFPVDRGHPMRFEPEAESGGLKPYVRVRARLDALVVRSLYYDLVGMGETSSVDGVEQFGVWSGGVFWPMMAKAELDAALTDASPS